MLVRILKTSRVHVFPGQTVEVRDSAELNYLISTGSAAVLRTAAPETPETEAEKQVETRTAAKPAARKTAAAKTTAAKTTARKK